MGTPGLGLEKPAPEQKQDLATLTAQTEQRMKSGAGWFFVIAALSLVNAGLALGGSQTRFIVGLGVTEIVNYIGSQTGSVGAAAALVITALVAAVFAGFGIMARKRHRWAFLVGMVLYGLDGLIFLLAQDWLSFGFHVFALFGLYGGLKAMNELQALTQPMVNTGPAPIG